MSCLLLIKSSSGGTLALKNLGFHYKSLFGPDNASIFFSQGWWIIRKFGMVMGDTSNDVTGALLFTQFYWIPNQGFATQNYLILLFPGAFLSLQALKSLFLM